MIISLIHKTKNVEYTLNIDNKEILKRPFIKFLGVYLDEQLNWHKHIQIYKSKISRSLYAINTAKQYLAKKHLKTLYYSFIHPYLEYGIPLWGSTHITYTKQLFIIQKKAIRILTNANYNAHTDPIFKELNILKLKDMYSLSACKLMYQHIHNMLPTPLQNMFTLNRNIHNYNTRIRDNPHFEKHRTTLALNTIKHKSPSIWNHIPNHIKYSETLKFFLKKCKQHFIAQYN